MIKYSQRLHIPRFFIHTDYWRIKEQKLFQENVESFKESLHNAAIIQKKIDTNTQIAFQIQYPALFTSSTPLKNILAAYLQSREFQNEDLVGQTLLLLGQAYQGRGQRSYFDTLDFQDTLGFDVLIKDIQYITDYKALTQAIRGLALLGIRGNQQIVDQAFKILQPKENTLIDDEQFRKLLQGVFPEDQTEPENNILHEIEVLIKQAQEDIFSAIDAIQTIRQLYLEMVELSKDEFISVNTNIKMLDFEEALVSNGLIAPREILKQDISLTMETAMNYLSGGSLDMLKFISTIMRLRYKSPIVEIPKVNSQKDYADLILAISELEGKQIAARLIESQNLLIYSNKIKLAQAFANAGLFQLSKQYLIEANDNSLESLMTAVQIGYHGQQFNFQLNISTLTLNELIAFLTYSGLQGERPQEGINELKDRLSYLNTIYDLTSIQQERIQSLGIFYKQRFTKLEFNIQHSELYNAIKATLPKQVLLIDDYDLSNQNEVNGYALLRSRKSPYMTIQDFLGLNKEQLKQKIMKAFSLKDHDVQLFNEIYSRLEQLNVEHSDQQLNQNTLFDIQLSYLKKRAINCLNNLDDLNKQKLKQALIDIEERAKIVGLNYSFSDVIDQIKTVPIDFPKWYGLIPSQTIFNAKQSQDGFKVSLLSNNVLNTTYCEDTDLIQRLSLNGLLTNLAPYPNPEKLRIQSIIPEIPKQIIQQAADDKDEFKGFLELRSNIIRDSQQYNPDTSDFFVVNILNFQAELKTKTLPEIVDTVFNLGIWNKLIDERNSGKKYQQPNGLFISRNPEVLLQNKLTPIEQSTTLKYLKEKLNQNEALNDLIKMRQELKQKLIQDVANHQVSPQTVTQVMEKVNTMISDKIDEIQGELRRQHSSIYFQQKTNYIDVLFKEKDLEKLQIKGSIDNYLDPDILHGLGQYVTIKRSRAEEKLITYYLMNKQIKGQQLNEKELKFLDTLDFYHPNITVTQLLVSDLNLPQSVNSNLMNFKEFSASDVLFQLSNLFDDQLFNDIVQKKYWRKQGLQYQMRRRDSTLLLQQQEKSAWIEQSRLNSKEIQDIKDMLHLTKVSDVQVEPLNQTDFPLQNIYSWIHAKSSEKVDLSILNLINDQLWEQIFQTKYQETTSEQLHQITENLLLRFYILQQNPVNQLRELITMILSHKNLSPLDKKNLQGFKKLVQFNSEDILNICRNEQITTVPDYLTDMCYPYHEILNI